MDALTVFPSVCFAPSWSLLPFFLFPLFLPSHLGAMEKGWDSLLKGVACGTGERRTVQRVRKTAYKTTLHAAFCAFFSCPSADRNKDRLFLFSVSEGEFLRIINVRRGIFLLPSYPPSSSAYAACYFAGSSSFSSSSLME